MTTLLQKLDAEIDAAIPITFLKGQKYIAALRLIRAQAELYKHCDVCPWDESFEWTRAKLPLVHARDKALQELEKLL